MQALRQFFYYLLYHPFAFAYDLVAAIVSVGRWKDWVLSVVPFIEGTRVLEIGHGPGHLQRVLLSRGLFAVGLDESSPMGRLAKRNLMKAVGQQGTASSTSAQTYSSQRDTSSTPQPTLLAYTQIQLTRGLAQHLPFPSGFFDTAIATFPSAYISDVNTLAEVRRCLSNGGRFVVLPVAIFMGRGLLDRFMAMLFRVTGQAPEDPMELFSERFKQPFVKAGFQVETHQVEVKSSVVLILVATKL